MLNYVKHRFVPKDSAPYGENKQRPVITCAPCLFVWLLLLPVLSNLMIDLIPSSANLHNIHSPSESALLFNNVYVPCSAHLVSLSPLPYPLFYLFNNLRLRKQIL